MAMRFDRAQWSHATENVGQVRYVLECLRDLAAEPREKLAANVRRGDPGEGRGHVARCAADDACALRVVQVPFNVVIEGVAVLKLDKSEMAQTS